MRFCARRDPDGFLRSGLSALDPCFPSLFVLFFEAVGGAAVKVVVHNMG